MRSVLLCLFLAAASMVFPSDGRVGANVSFALVGDIMMGTTFPDDSNGKYLPADGGKRLFDSARHHLAGADVAIGNLEGTFAEAGTGKVKECRDESLCYAFRMPVDYVGNLVDAGFDVMAIANNHINDFGSDGVESTVETLKNAGIMITGNNRKAQVALVSRGGRRIAVVGFGHSPGTPSIMDLGRMERIVKAADSMADIVVVSFHGGGEGAKFDRVTGKPEHCFGEDRGNVREFARAAVNAGADIVFGHGPHVVRGMELYKDRLIAYSLGNFCTPYRVSLAGKNSYAPLLTVDTDRDGRFVGGRIISMKQRRGVGPEIDPGHSAAREIRRLSTLDFPGSQLVIDNDGQLSKKEIR